MEELIRVLKELIDKCNGSGWEHWLNMEHKHTLTTLLHALKAVEIPKKKKIEYKGDEFVPEGYRADGFNQALAACQPFLIKQQVRIEQLMKANDTLREINNRLEVDKIEELEK